MKKKLLALAALPVLFTTQAAHAALDTAVTTAIDGAKADLLSLFAALTAAGVAIWVGRLIYKKFVVR